MKQLVSAPPHILQNSQSCTDLIFVNQPNVVIEYVIHSSLHENCHHKLYFANLILRLSICNLILIKNQTDLTNHAIDQFDLVNLFLDKNINEQVILLNRTILNIFQNFIPYTIV